MAEHAQGDQNGPRPQEDTFERDLNQMLKEGVTLNDQSSTVQGSADSSPVYSPSFPPSGQQGSIPRSHSVPPATSTIPLSSPERNGHGSTSPPTLPGQNSKLDTIRSWTMNTYKCTRQMISEKLGKGSKTVDLELEAQIEVLRDTQKKYANILRLTRALTQHFYNVVQTQRTLGDTFADLSQKNPELQEEFTYNAETQKALCKNGETLLGALNFFTSSVNTLCNKTMEDTLMTIKNYETARVEYDAYRTDLEALQLGPRDAATVPKIEEAQRKFAAHKEKFDRLRADVSVKLRFLDENKVKVIQRQLFLMHRAFGSFIKSNFQEMQDCILKFNISQKDIA